MAIEDAARTAIRDLAPGYIVFNPPDQARVGDREQVEVRISTAFPDQVKDRIQRLKTGLRGRGAPRLEDIQVGDRMKVGLEDTDHAFSITALSETEQQILSPYALWQWDVTPQKSGVHTLTLKVTAVVVVPGQDPQPRSQPVFDRHIKVRVNLPYSTARFWDEHWEWILGTPMVSGLMAWGANVVWRRLQRA